MAKNAPAAVAAPAVNTPAAIRLENYEPAIWRPWAEKILAEALQSWSLYNLLGEEDGNRQAGHKRSAAYDSLTQAMRITDMLTHYPELASEILLLFNRRLVIEVICTVDIPENVSVEEFEAHGGDDAQHRCVLSAGGVLVAVNIPREGED